MFKLLQDFPELAKYVKNIDGKLIIQEEGLDELEDKMARKGAAANAANIEAQDEADKADNAIEFEKLREKTDNEDETSRGFVDWIGENGLGADFSNSEKLKQDYVDYYTEKYGGN